MLSSVYLLRSPLHNIIIIVLGGHIPLRIPRRQRSASNFVANKSTVTYNRLHVSVRSNAPFDPASWKATIPLDIHILTTNPPSKIWLSAIVPD